EFLVAISQKTLKRRLCRVSGNSGRGIYALRTDDLGVHGLTFLTGKSKQSPCHGRAKSGYSATLHARGLRHPAATDPLSAARVWRSSRAQTKPSMIIKA